MRVHLCIRNESRYKRYHRTDAVRALAERVCAGEGVEGDVELSVLLCDDAFICELNAKYRHKNTPTDVLAFGQGRIEGHKGPAALGDVVISLETVARRCAKGHGGVPDRIAVRDELHLLFCHGLLHLLGSDHATAQARKDMNAKQAGYLGVSMETAWRAIPDRLG